MSIVKAKPTSPGRRFVVSVKNDDALVKLAAIVQRIVSASAKDDEGNEFGMSDEERRRLLEEAEEEIKSIQKTTDPKIKQSKEIEDTDVDVHS